MRFCIENAKWARFCRVILKKTFTNPMALFCTTCWPREKFILLLLRLWNGSLQKSSIRKNAKNRVILPQIALQRFITKWEMLHIPGFLKFISSQNLSSGRSNGERNRQLEGCSARQYNFEDLQRCANSSWLTDGSDHNRNYNFSMWPHSDLSILCYFLAAVPSLKFS